MSKHLAMAPVAVMLSLDRRPVINAAMQCMSLILTQPDESIRVTGEPQNCSEALLLLRPQDHANTLVRTQQSLEATCTAN